MHSSNLALEIQKQNNLNYLWHLPTPSINKQLTIHTHTHIYIYGETEVLSIVQTSNADNRHETWAKLSCELYLVVMNEHTLTFMTTLGFTILALQTIPHKTCTCGGVVWQIRQTTTACKTSQLSKKKKQKNKQIVVIRRLGEVMMMMAIIIANICKIFTNAFHSQLIEMQTFVEENMFTSVDWFCVSCSNCMAVMWCVLC